MSPPQNARIGAIPVLILAAAAISGCATSAGGTIPESGSAFTDEQLAELCEEVTREPFGDDVTYELDDARIEARTVEPEWLVLIRVDMGNGMGEAQCTIGGTPDDPIVEMSSASLHPFPEEHVQELIRGENEGGTQ